jgi:hypothetical protein
MNAWTPETLPLAAQIGAAKRELALREKCYPDWVRKHRLRQVDADYEILAMKAIIISLERQHAAFVKAGLDQLSGKGKQ